MGSWRWVAIWSLGCFLLVALLFVNECSRSEINPSSALLCSVNSAPTADSPGSLDTGCHIAQTPSVFVTGFHHSGTTIMEAQLCNQNKFCQYSRSDRPVERTLNAKTLCRMARLADKSANEHGTSGFVMKKPSNDLEMVEELSTAILVHVPRITVVVCIRDPASTAWSRAMRSGAVRDKTIRGPLEKQRSVNEAWASFARTFPGRVIFVPLESFSKDPNRYLSLILNLPNGKAPPRPALTMTEAEKEDLLSSVFSRDSNMTHNERRVKQSGLPVYPVLVDDWRAEASQEQQSFVDAIVAQERVAEVSEGLVGLVNRTRLRRER